MVMAVEVKTEKEGKSVSVGEKNGEEEERHS